MNGNERSPLGTDDTGSTGPDDPGFVWANEQLASASREELVAHVADLQDRMQEYEMELVDVRATLRFLLDAQAGFVDPDDVIGGADHHQER